SPLLYPSASDSWFMEIMQTVGLILFKRVYIHRVRVVYRTPIITNLFEDLNLSTFFAQKRTRRKKGDLHFASKCIIFALQERRCYPDR
ncbi:MAG: hypothetical protein U0L77_07915, partial [Prevotellamassilia sp.]|nr:hypothetical protein [Prevotellamassilia sp.]